LGLIIAKRLTELHGGRFAVESEPMTRTTVSLELPA
jgi:signal transduction histidine kinase